MPRKVYIDAGHGGNDPGAVDGKGLGDTLYTEEEDLNLACSLKLQSALLRCGIYVGMSRATDVYPSLAARYNAAGLTCGQ